MGPSNVKKKRMDEDLGSKMAVVGTLFIERPIERHGKWRVVYTNDVSVKNEWTESQFCTLHADLVTLIETETHPG